MKRAKDYLFTRSTARLFLLNILVIFFMSCEKEVIDPEPEAIDLQAQKAHKNAVTEPFEFSAPAYDIAAAPDGSILVGLNRDIHPAFETQGTAIVQQIKNGKMRTMVEFATYTPLQGIAPVGTGNAFVTTGGADLAEHGELYRVSNGNVRLVADLGDYEFQNDPDANFGIQWKDQECEDIDGFSPGPQNNPFKVAALSGNTALVADAAGNTLLKATTTGHIDWMAIFTPPVDNNGDWLVRWTTVNEAGEPIPCYVQPVPTSVAIGPDGYVYVGELTGAVAEDAGLPIGLSRVWKIPADANNVVCQEGSGPCEVIIDGLTSVIDLAIGPDGLLYVVEFDEMSWISSFAPGLAAGGTIGVYELEGTHLYNIPAELSFPSAITFDKDGNLWVLENNSIDLEGYPPRVRMLEY